ncbi:rod shape-determining protein MreB [Hutsoniella sourekii]
MAREIGIDLGTANVLIHLKGHGIVLNEPSLVAVDKTNDEIVAIGKEAREMIGRTSQSIEVIQPLKGGVISDFALTEAMLVLFFERIYQRQLFSRPDVLICAPTNVSEVEKIALVEAMQQLGAGNIFVEEEAKIAGIGAGIDILDASGNMVIDIGGGTTDIVVLSGKDIVASESIKLAGDDFDQRIIQFIQDQDQLLIGQRTAEAAKCAIASATLLTDKELVSYEVKGRDLASGLPRAINIDSNDIYLALRDQLIIIARTAKRVLESVPPELQADIFERGVMLTGGGAMIYNMDSFLSHHLAVTVIKAEQPMSCVAIGSGLMLDLIKNGDLETLSSNNKRSIWQRFTKWWRTRLGI